MNATSLEIVHVVDSHTGGEPTRVVLSGGPALVGGSLLERRGDFAARFDGFRSAVVNEPRGFDAVVGALLCPPGDPTCAAGVIFFNNVGYLNMCGHGTIGLLVTLSYLGRLGTGTHRIDTPVGVVEATLHGPNEVSVRNVASFRAAKGVSVDVPGHGAVVGDVAWGGNWFFLVDRQGPAIELANLDALLDFSWKVRQALERAGIRGEHPDGTTGEIDHIELFGPPSSPQADGKNFVLCPGRAYDRSPCGTGTSAKLACLYEDGKLGIDQPWRQESLIGSIFEGRVAIESGQLIPQIRGSAYVTADADLILQPDDPFRQGIRP
jgi:4-hydroxyproline epimerase